MIDSGLLMHLAPELILLVGACVVLIAGNARLGERGPLATPLTLITVVIALTVSLNADIPEAGFAAVGLWLTPLTYYTRCIALGIGALLILVNWNQPVARERGEYMAMVLFSLLGVLITSSANDLIVLFFALELASVPTYVLIALSREDTRAAESAVKYFFLGALSSAILAYGLSFLYGAAGTTTLHIVREGVASANLVPGALRTVGLVGLLLTFAGLAFKIAAVPFHVYAPDVYEGAASPVTGLLGFVPKIAGFLALIKIFTAFNWDLPVAMFWVVWTVSALTMTVGNVLALLQHNVKRMLAYSSIAHTGYMLIALLVGPASGVGPMRDGVGALLFYIAVYGAMNLGAFALLAAYRISGRSVETLDDLSGLATRAPAAALALAICVFSLMGFPPTAGFLGKVYIFSSAFSLAESNSFHGPLVALAIIGVINSAVAAAYYLRIIMSVFMGRDVSERLASGGKPVRWGLALCSVAMLLVFAWPAPLTSGARGASSAIFRAIPAGRDRVQVAESAPASKAHPAKLTQMTASSGADVSPG